MTGNRPDAAGVFDDADGDGPDDPDRAAGGAGAGARETAGPTGDDADDVPWDENPRRLGDVAGAVVTLALPVALLVPLGGTVELDGIFGTAESIPPTRWVVGMAVIALVSATFGHHYRRTVPDPPDDHQSELWGRLLLMPLFGSLGVTAVALFASALGAADPAVAVLGGVMLLVMVVPLLSTVVVLYVGVPAIVGVYLGSLVGAIDDG